MEQYEKPILGILTEEQVNRGVSVCTLCKYKQHPYGGDDCRKCINEGQPHQFYL